MSGEHGGPTVPPRASSSTEPSPATSSDAPPPPAGHTHAFYPPPAVDSSKPAGVSPSCFACGRPPLIYARLAAVTRTVRAVAKKGFNSEHNYSFRSIDDFYNALSPALGEHEVIVQPNITHRERTIQGKTRGGADIVRLQTRTRFRLFTVDGSFMEVDIDSESIDYGGDKAPFKAASGAYKYLVMQVFAVRVEQEETPENEHDNGEPDRDRRGPKGPPPSKWTGARGPRERSVDERTPPPDDEREDQGVDVGPELAKVEAALRTRLAAVKDLVEFEAWAVDYRASPGPVKAALREPGLKRKAELTDEAAKVEAARAHAAAEGSQAPAPASAEVPAPKAPPETKAPAPASSPSNEPCWIAGPNGASCQLAAGHGGGHKDGDRTWPQASKKGGRK